MQMDPVIIVTLLNDPNDDPNKLLVFVEPKHCHNLRLERHDKSILIVADVYTDSVYLLKDGRTYRFPMQNRFVHPGSVSFTPVVLSRFDPHRNHPFATFEPRIRGENIACEFLVPPLPPSNRLDVGDSVTKLRKVKKLGGFFPSDKLMTKSRVWMLCAGCGRSHIFHHVPDRCDTCHSEQIECMVLEEPISGSTLPL